MVVGTETWGSIFWQMRQLLGQVAADKLLFDAWFALHPDDVQTDRGASFLRKLLEIDTAHQSQIKAIFAGRGLTL